MDIAILLYDNVTALDAVGPYEVLSRMPGASVHFVAVTPGLKRADAGLGLYADLPLTDLAHPDIVLVPGSSDPTGVLTDPAVLGWLNTAHETATWTTSVCSGSLILAAAGLLHDRPATTHWIAFDPLRRLGAVPVRGRLVVADRIITSAGVSAGIELALRLATLLHGDDIAQALQLVVEYEPEPPFAITAHTAPEHLRALAAQLLDNRPSADTR
jgi:transcriptional regulator GlxA family with amidase domain